MYSIEGTMFKLILKIATSLLITSSCYAMTGDSLNYLTTNDTIFLHSNFFKEKIFIHEMEVNQTLFSLARFYGLTVEQLYYYNNNLRAGNIDPGSKVRVPIPNRAIHRYIARNVNPREFIPVYYIAKKGDTMFRIAKVLFRMEIEEMMARNGLETTTIHVGQLLHVGWMNINGIPPDYRFVPQGPLYKKNRAMRSVFEKEAQYKSQHQGQGVAAWKPDGDKNSDFYALHNNAALNSTIAITNPMSRRTCYAKVIGRIPITTYDPKVKVVLSPLAAKFLGAKDPRFFVKLRYLR